MAAGGDPGEPGTKVEREGVTGMAGEWIAMGADLWTSPELIRLSAFVLTGCQQSVSACQTRESAKCCAIGAMYRFWTIVDMHCDDGILSGYSESDIDYEVGIPGWAEAMQSVGWLSVSPEGLSVPGFEKWFSRSAKRRRMNACYQADSRARRQHSVSTDADKMLTTVQKRTVQKKNKKTPLPPSVPGPLNTPEFCQAWSDWQDFRRQKKKPLTSISMQKQLAQFVEWGVPRAIAAIEYTIRKDWQGLREPDEESSTSVARRSTPRADAAMQEFLDAHGS